MLRAMGAHVMTDGASVRVSPAESLNAVDFRVPGDISAAAFWMVLAAAHPDAEITLPAVGINPTRTGVIDALRAMGAAVEVTEERNWGGEPVADITVRSSRLTGAAISGQTVLSAMDEVPVLAVAAALASGQTVIRDAEELRVKESDRIATVIEGLRRMGVEVEERPDGMVIEGRGRLRSAVLESEGDHRLAMAWAVAGLVAEAETTVAGAEAVDISYPAFWRDLSSLGGKVDA
jgi:3-phosphoshikimate 1-carboxyvinyltransferase